jgi:8-oxo-dGTP pyrophosphatase MutT (NUDIX family)
LTQDVIGRETGIQVAALPLQRSPAGQVVVGLITSRGTGRWVLPKGWPMPGMSLAEAAAREAREEAGFVGEIADSPIGHYTYMKTLHTLADMLCDVQVFPLYVSEQLAEWREYNQRRVAFFWPEAAAQCVDEPELAALLRTLV